MPGHVQSLLRRCKNCGHEHWADETCPVHWEARLTGHEDRQRGEAVHALEWPSGQYGYADYWIGFYGGDKERG